MEDHARLARWIWVVAVVALATRAIVLVAFWPTWIWWSGDIHDDWNKLAINWMTSGTFGFTPTEPTIRRGPVFPLLEIVLFMAFREAYIGWSVALLALDACTSVLIVLLGRRLWGNRTALLAGLFHAIYLPVVYYSAQIEQFTVVLPLVAVWFYLLSAWDLDRAPKYHWLSLGLVSGALILSKTVYLPVVVGSAFAFAWVKRRHNGMLVVKHLVTMLLVAALLVVPWTYRNYVVTNGSFVPVQSLFWSVLWQRFVISDLAATEGWDRPSGRTLEYILARQKELIDNFGSAEAGRLTGAHKELLYDRAYRTQVLAWVTGDPIAYARHIVTNIWGFWVGAENLRKTLLMAAMQVPLLSIALLGLGLSIRYRQVRTLRFGLVFIAILWAEHSLVLGWGRFSLDTVPVLGIISGKGLDAWLAHRAHLGSDHSASDNVPVPSSVSALHQSDV